MSDNSIAFAGMDRAGEEEIRSMFDRANSAAGGAFELGTEDSATVLVVDVDSIHGHMTWLRVQNNPDRIVVAISSRHTPHAHHCLVRPVSAESFGEVLASIAAGLPDTGAATAEEENERAEADPRPESEPESESELESLPERPRQAEPEHPLQPEASPEAEVETEAEAAAQTDEPPPANKPPAPPARKRLGDYLVPGRLPGPSRLAFPNAPELVVDPEARAYLGPTQLKGFAAYAQAAEITPEQWEPVSPEQLAALAGSHGTPQPWIRLAWLSGLYRSPGELAPGHTLDDRFGLLKWPQIEREFPRHFRIATTMMKGPATASEIAEASGAPLDEVIDFLNASLAAGQAERVVEEAPPEEPPAKGGGLLNRLKGLRGN